jgi:hypothetical protein
MQPLCRPAAALASPTAGCARQNRRFLIVAFTLALAGCGSQPSPPRDLAGTCQFRTCVCARDGNLHAYTSDTRPVEWQLDGAASCPAGYSLRLPPPRL